MMMLMPAVPTCRYYLLQLKLPVLRLNLLLTLPRVSMQTRGASVDHLAGQVEARADCVQIFDSWAGDLPDGLRQRYCFSPISRIIESLRARCGAVPVIGFARGLGAG